MASTSTKVGHFLAKVLRIDLNYRDEIPEETLTRGESVFSVQTSDTFVEQQPTSAEWIREVLPSGKDLVTYTRSLFPFTYWIGRYNLQWLAGDLVAGKSYIAHPKSKTMYFNYSFRHHHWRSGRSTINGIRWLGQSCPRIWLVFIFHGCSYLLVLCYFQGHHNWRMYR